MRDSQTREEASILIVDDQSSNVIILSEAVKGLGRLRFATSGHMALDMMMRDAPDLVLLDIEMPGMDGYEVSRQMGADPKLKDVPIIFVTSHDPDVHEQLALDRGGVDFLHKPLNLPIARARVRTQLSLKRKSKQLATAKRNLEAVMGNLPAFIAQWSRDQHNVFCNDAAGSWFGLPAEQMRGMMLSDVLQEGNYLAMEPLIHAALHGSPQSFDLTFIRAGHPPLYGQVSLVDYDQPEPDAGFLMLITDITARKEAEMALHDEKERIRVMLNAIGDAVIATDANGRVTFINPIAETMTGWQMDEAAGQPVEQVMPLQLGDGGQSMQNPIRLALKENRAVGMSLDCQLIRRDGEPQQIENSASPILDRTGCVTGAIAVFHDISETKALAVKMTHLAHHDALTNLPNKMLLRDRTELALQTSRHSRERRVALMMLDIDLFKIVNDAVGHTVGDQLLKQMAARLARCLRPSDTLSRQGGDEFIVLAPAAGEVEQIGALANALQLAASEPYEVEGNRFDLSVSIGISLYPDDAKDLETLFRHADAAMYRAKQEGRSRLLFFSAEIEEALRVRHMLERHIRAALERDEFAVHYQSKLDVDEQRIVGVEALVRWPRHDDGYAMPAQFIPLAEETGLIIPIGHLVLRQACLDGARWHRDGQLVRIAVNVSAVQIVQADFIARLRAILAESGLQPALLELELTEGVLAQNTSRMLDTLAEIKSIGVSIAIDDFGTGYSSLAYLKRFPIDVLKIDQSFVRDMLTDPSDKGIIEAIVKMGQSLNLRLVAEGVETVDQAHALRSLGCHIMQGYLFGAPMPAADMHARLRWCGPASTPLDSDVAAAP